MKVNIGDPRLNGMVITNDDVRLAGHCGSGFRDWARQTFGQTDNDADSDAEFAARHTKFLSEGMPVFEWLGKGDFMAERVVMLKLRRESNE